MKKIIYIILLSVLISANCKKNELPPKAPVIPVTIKDISRLSLDSLKKTLTGNWKLAYTFGYPFGYTNYANTYINFFNFADSIKWIENNIVTVNTFASYQKIRSIYSIHSYDSSYSISHTAIAHNGFYEWVAEKFINDTLVLRDNHTNPRSYYLVK